jgi:hypothetical protein
MLDPPAAEEAAQHGKKPDQPTFLSAPQPVQGGADWAIAALDYRLRPST